MLALMGSNYKSCQRCFAHFKVEKHFFLENNFKIIKSYDTSHLFGDAFACYQRENFFFILKANEDLFVSTKPAKAKLLQF